MNNINYNFGFFNTNFYWMEYKNQLITTGELNDVGGYIRTNAKKAGGLVLKFQIELL